MNMVLDTWASVTAAIAFDYPGEETRIVCRYRVASFKGSGSGTEGRCMLIRPDGSRGWAIDLANNKSGSWSNREQGVEDCTEEGSIPGGTIVVAFDQVFSRLHYHTYIAAGIAIPGLGVSWGLQTRKVSNDVFVEHPRTGEWLKV